MTSVSSIALSGLRGAQMRIDSSAHNIANAQTPGFRRQLVSQETQAGGGVRSGVVAQTVTATEVGEALAEDIVGQKVASYAFQANLLVLRTDQRMQGSLLDVLA